jgi:hypothetical protein
MSIAAFLTHFLEFSNNRMSASSIKSSNPYHVAAGRDLDAYIHGEILKNGPTKSCPNYSTELKDADALRRSIEAKHKMKIVSGKTLAGKVWFARYEIDTGNPTEVHAETYPLAICRLVLLRVKRV